MTILTGPVHVVGTGLIGTSLGLALSRAGVEVTLEDVQPDRLQEAVSRAAGRARDAQDPDPVLVVAATPPGRVGAVLAEAARRWPAVVCTDVASVKAVPMADAVALGVSARQLVGGHPMAGREVSGPAGARAGLFDDRVWVVCPTEDSDPTSLEAVRVMATTCGAVVVAMDPVAHDRAVALISHTPQVLSSVLAGRLLDASVDTVGVAGQGLRDMTRIAGSDPGLWEEILTLNRESVVRELRGILQDLGAVVDDLDPRDGADPSGIRQTLERGVEGRSRIPGKHGSTSTDFEVVSVMVRDEPGELARLFVAAGDLDVNLEDVRIEHVLGRPSGLIDLSVRPFVASRLRAGLLERGFDVRT